jgi:hypothetical protein
MTSDAGTGSTLGTNLLLLYWVTTINRLLVIDLGLTLVINRMNHGWGQDSIISRGSLLLECNRLMNHDPLPCIIY